MKIGVKRVGEPVQFIESNEKYRSNCAAKLINKETHIKPQFVYLSPECDLCLAVDEDGLAKELTENFLMEMNSPFWPIQKMVGTVVFLRTKPLPPFGEIWDYEIEDLRDEDCEFITRILDEEYQKQLKMRFTDYERGNIMLVPMN